MGQDQIPARCVVNQIIKSHQRILPGLGIAGMRPGGHIDVGMIAILLHIRVVPGFGDAGMVALIADVGRRLGGLAVFQPEKELNALPIALVVVESPKTVGPVVVRIKEPCLLYTSPSPRD